MHDFYRAFRTPKEDLEFSFLNHISGINKTENTLSQLGIFSDHFSGSFIESDKYIFPLSYIPDFQDTLGDLSATTNGENTSRRISPVSTETRDVNLVNQEFYSFLASYSQAFIQNLKVTDFEDGVENFASREIRRFIKHNEFVTYTWLNTIFSNNQKDPDIIAGLLRIIGMVVEQDHSDMLLPIVKAGLADTNSKTQEAAIMVIEQWRTKNCLDALQTTFFSYLWLKEYAETIESELIEELALC